MISNELLKRKVLSKLITDNEYPVTTLSDLVEKKNIGDGDWILSDDMCQCSNNKLIQLGSIGMGIYIDKPFKYIGDDTFDRIKCSEINEGDLLLNRFISNNQLSGCLVPKIDGRLLTSVDVCWIKEDKEKYSNKYLMYCFLSEEVQKKILLKSSGTTRIRISKNNLIKIPIPVPPVSKQKELADRIDKLFYLIDKKEKNDQEKNKLKEVMKEKIIDSAIHGTLVNNDSTLNAVDIKEISDEKPFEIPKNWKWTTIEKSCVLTSGVTLKNEYQSGDYLYIKVGDMNLSENQKFITTSSRYTTKEEAKSLIPVNSIIFPKRGGAILTNKKRLVLNSPICVDLNTMAITPCDEIDIYYFYYWFSLIDLGTLNNGTAVPQINNKDMNPLKIPVPPLEEQKRIVEKIESLFKLIEQL